MAVVARQVDDDQPWVIGGKALHLAPAIVAGTVVDEQDFVIIPDRSARGGGDARVQHGKARGFVITGNDNG
ncbi:hypothetical protein D9M73_109650 [compost metagenome]